MAIINQTPVPGVRRSLGWKTVVDNSLYHRIVTPVYVGLLGIEKNMPEELSMDFYRHYTKGRLLQEAHDNAEEVLRWQLETNGIKALILGDTSMEALYRTPDMACVRQLEFLVQGKDIWKINELMRDMDYERKLERLNPGILYTRVPGIRVVFYERIPVENKVFQRHFPGLAKGRPCLEGHKWIRVLPPEERYLYCVGKLVEGYILGTMRIRDILDFWQYHRTLGEDFPWKAVREVADKAGWTEFLKQTELLGKLWFGVDENEQFGTALELEEYILSHCRCNDELDARMLPYETIQLDFYRRNRNEEWARRKRAWLFPPQEYMEKFFPVLEKHPKCLVFCWIIRDSRFLKKMISGKLHHVLLRLFLRIFDARRSVREWLREKKEERAAAKAAREDAAREAEEGGTAGDTAGTEGGTELSGSGDTI